MMFGLLKNRVWLASALALLMVGGMVLLPQQASAHSRRYNHNYASNSVRFYNTPLFNNNPYRIVRNTNFVRPCQVSNSYNYRQDYYRRPVVQYVTPYRRNNVVVSSGFNNYFPIGARYGF